MREQTAKFPMNATAGEALLTPEQKTAVDGAHGWVTESAAALGLAYLEYQEARQRYELAEKNLAAKASATRQSEIQRGQVMAKLAELLELGPGHWVYDGQNKLVKKDNPNAKSS